MYKINKINHYNLLYNHKLRMLVYGHYQIFDCSLSVDLRTIHLHWSIAVLHVHLFGYCLRHNTECSA